jgi:hypothetical protein
VTLSGGEIDTVSFTVNMTGAPEGITTIDGLVSGTENNRGTSVSDDTGDGGTGQIELQTPADVQIVTAAPSRPAVTQNEGTDWEITLTLHNYGLSDADLDLPGGVRVTIADNTGGMAYGSVNGLESGGTLLRSNDTGTLVIPVTSTGSFDPLGPGKNLHVEVDYVEVNTNDPFTAQRDTTITVQDPPNLSYVAGSLDPDAASTNTLVHFEVQVSNLGSNLATAVLNRAQTRLHFTDQVSKASYSAFLDLSSDDTIDGGETATLVFETKELSLVPGDYDVNLDLYYTENDNNVVTNLVIPNELTVAVAPRLQITSIQVSQPTVTQAMTTEWIVSMFVQNNGPAGVNVYFDDRTDITFEPQSGGVDGTYTVVTPDTLASGDPNDEIANGETDEIRFRVTRTGDVTGPVTIQGRVAANDQGSELDVEDDTFDGGSGLVTVQTPPDLSTSVAIIAPASAADGDVSPGQTFTVGATVANLGEAGLAGPSEVTLTLPPGFTLPNLDTTQTFTADVEVTWEVQAPGAPTTQQYIRAEITAVPQDANSGVTAFASQPADSTPVTVTGGGDYGASGIEISTPTGAQDRTLSTGQTFTVRAHVTPSSDVVDLAATLTVPPDFESLGATVRNLPDGDGTEQTVDFNMRALNTAVDTIDVTFTGTDRNTTEDLDPLVLRLPVEVVPRASLTVTASVTEPPDATDGSVTVSTPFTITARVDNAPGAAGIVAPGQLTITVPTGAGYQLDVGETATQSFTIGADVEWRAIAAPQPVVTPQNFTIEIVLPAPADENSGAPADVPGRQAIVTMVTEGAAVGVTDVSTSMGLERAVVPAGASDIGILGLALRYAVTDTLLPDARIDTFAVTVLGPDGRPLGGGDVARTLRRVFVEFPGGETYQTTSITQNPVVVSLTGGAGEFIPPGDTRRVAVGVDVAQSPSVEEIRLQARGSGIVVRDADSEARLGVFDDATDDPLNGQIVSQPLVILGGNFEEYVHNYPNPFSPIRHGGTKIAYFMTKSGSVEIKIYAITGELVYELSLSAGDPGTAEGPQEIEWDGRNGDGEAVRNGIYVCILTAGSNSAKFRIAVAK